jgi:hypothetical protein
VCRLGVLQQSAAVAHAAAGAVPLPVPPLDSPASSNPCSPREEEHVDPHQPQLLLQEAWAQPTAQLWHQQQQQQGDREQEPGSPRLQQPQRWVAAAAAAGVEDASAWEGSGGPRDDAKPQAQVRPAFLDQLATVSPKASAARPGLGASHQEQQQQEQSVDQQQQGFRDVWASGPRSDQAAPLLRESQADMPAAASAAAGRGLSASADYAAGTSALLWVGGAAGGTQSASLLQALGCLEAAEQQGQQVLCRQQLLQQGSKEEEGEVAVLAGGGATSGAAAARSSREVLAHSMELRSLQHGSHCQQQQQQQQQLVARSSASLGILQLAQAVAGAVSSSLGRLSWPGSAPGSPLQQLAGPGTGPPPAATAAATAPAAGAMAAAGVVDEGEEAAAMGWYRMREDSADDVGVSGSVGPGTLQGMLPPPHLHHLYQQQHQHQQQQVVQRTTGPLEQLVAVKLQQGEVGDLDQVAGAGYTQGLGLAGRYQQRDSLDAAEGTASYSPPTAATAAAEAGGQAAAGAAAAGRGGTGEGLGMGGRPVPPASSFAQSCTVQMGVFSDASYAAHLEAGDALSCHGPAAAAAAAAPAGALRWGEGASTRLQDTASSGSGSKPAGLGAAEGAQVASGAAAVEELLDVGRPAVPSRRHHHHQQQQQQSRVPPTAAAAARQPHSSRPLPRQQPVQAPLQVQGPARLHQRAPRPVQRHSSGKPSAAAAAVGGAAGGGAAPTAAAAAVPAAAKGRAGAARAPKQPWQGVAGSKAGPGSATRRVQTQQRAASKAGAAVGAGVGPSGRSSSPARTLVKLRVSTEGVVLVPGDAASPPPPPVRWVPVTPSAV